MPHELTWVQVRQRYWVLLQVCLGFGLLVLDIERFGEYGRVSHLSHSPLPLIQAEPPAPSGLAKLQPLVARCFVPALEAAAPAGGSTSATLAEAVDGIVAALVQVAQEAASGSGMPQTQGRKDVKGWSKP